MSYILIAEDDRDILLVMLRKLDLNGYHNTWTTANGQEALEKALAERPDLLLLDVMLVDLDGLAVCAAVKEHYGADAPPVIITSARGQSMDLRQGQQAGADAYLIKPYSPSELLELVREHLPL